MEHYLYSPICLPTVNWKKNLILTFTITFMRMDILGIKLGNNFEIKGIWLYGLYRTRSLGFICEFIVSVLTFWFLPIEIY
jgi:hypothetical protein